MSKSSDAQALPRSMRRSAGCPFFRRLLSQGQTTTHGRELEFPECIDMRHLLRRMIEGRCDRTFAIVSQQPALICKTIEAIVVTENEMVEQPNAEQVAGFPQSRGKRPIFGARRGIAGLMVMNGCDVKSR